MRNPWLDIPFADYEGHMSLPSVGQARLLADIFADALQKHAPSSLAVIGCAGGNGFEHIDPWTTRRVVGVDINPAFLEQARARFTGRFETLDLIRADIGNDELSFEQVDLLFAALILEYVDIASALLRLRGVIEPAGTLVTVVQLPSETLPAVSPSPFTSLNALEPIMHFVDPLALRTLATKHGLAEVGATLHATPAGKQFLAQSFLAEA
jgi:SAM-dependent methyltransferase